ncbi:MAG TPA: hypothetical protein VK961_01695 [Chthoniobacter sp.]|nr:hypothetical protein [Chthoniobacter sp.]
MSASSDLQTAIIELLGQPGALRVNVPLVARRTKEMAADIEAAAANQGLCIFVMPPLPTSTLQGNPFVFFDKAEVRVRIVEQPAMNQAGADAYDLVDDVANALHWQPKSDGTQLGNILAHPLQLASRPCELIDDPQARIIEVIFEAVYGLQPAS